MKIYEFTQRQHVPARIDEIWDFFSDPKNLEKITPSSMNFEILDDGGAKEIYEGQLIHYNVSPFPFFRTRWVTEITNVTPKISFTDSQKKGPFSLWRHRHDFKVYPDGVEMIDVVNYSVPMGALGKLANELFVRSRVEYIFEYRRKRVEEIFVINPPAKVK